MKSNSTYIDYPYGMVMPNRHGSSNEGYRYCFQGQEKDDEVKGEGNSVNYKYRMHDPRIGRFFAVDPLAPKYPMWSPYAFSGNQVIHTVELEGLEPDARLDADGNTIPNQVGEVRAGVEGGNADINNSWNAYRWTENSDGSQRWVNLGELWVDDRYVKGGQTPRSSDVLPSGLSNVKISPFNNQGDYQLEGFTLKDGESFRRLERKNGKGSGTIGFWNSSGGMYSGTFNSDGIYAGNRYETNMMKLITYDDIKGLSLNTSMWLQYSLEAGKDIASDLFLGWLTAKGGSGTEGPIDPFASHDNRLDKQAKLGLMISGPGSYVDILTGVGYPNDPSYGTIYRRYWFKGYSGANNTPIFKIEDINVYKKRIFMAGY